jgi:branched-chain amino acid transport system permease protein
MVRGTKLRGIFKAQLLLNELTLGSVYAMMAVGFALVFNILKFSNYSQGAHYCNGLYGGF